MSSVGLSFENNVFAEYVRIADVVFGSSSLIKSSTFIALSGISLFWQSLVMSYTVS